MKIKLRSLSSNFCNTLNRVQTLYFEKHHSSAPIHHYTTLDSGLNILKNRNFRLTHYKDMNDTNELTYNLDQFISIVVNKVKGLEKRIICNILDKTKNKYNMYMTCFSETPNSLPMWRFYGSGGNGIVIGFDRKISTEHNQNYIEHEDFKIAKVSYDNGAFQDVVNLIELFNLIMSQDSFKAMSKNDQKNYILSHTSELAQLIFMLSMIIKNKEYLIEDEVRLILLDREDGEYQFPKEKIKFKDADDEIIKMNDDNMPILTTSKRNVCYLESNQFHHNAVKEIWFGHKLDKKTISYIKQHLKINNYNIENIRFEQCHSSYR